MKQVNVNFVCEGVKPILMEPMDDETLEHLRTGTRPSSSAKKEAKPETIAASKLYKDADGKVAIPTDNFWACLVEAGALVSYKGKRNLSNATESLLPGMLDIREDYLKFTDGDGYVVDKRRGVLDNGTAVCIVRPRFNRWGFSGTLQIDTDQVSVEKIKELVEAAGRFKGLGGHRRKGRFGRFQLTTWEVVGEEKKSK